MEKQYKHTLNGQAVQTQDLDLLGESSGLADDRVFAELFRMTPYNGSTVSRGILPYGHASSSPTGELIGPNGASGSVLVSPFRALVGSRTAAGTDAKANWRDIRSALFIGSGTSLTQSPSLAANSSGNNRIDLVYAAVSVDASGPTDTRLVKDPTTTVIAPATVSPYLQTTVIVAVVTGTAGASPAYPSLPSDSGGTYYIPLAYVRVPNGFSASSTVLNTNIAIVAPAIAPSPYGGIASMQVADQHYAIGVGIPATFGTAGLGAGFLPSTLVGSQGLFMLNVIDTTPLPFTSGTAFDSRNWTGRFCKATIGYTNLSTGDVFVVQKTFSTTVTGTTATLVQVDDTQVPTLAASSSVRIYIDDSDSTGRLRISWTGSPHVQVNAYFEFTGVLANW